MAARAKKILQEEGSHRVHGEAWAKRLCRSDQRDAFVARLLETWAQASRWIGPDEDPAYAAALEAGEVRQTAAHQRALVRDWLTALLEGEGVPISLPDPDFTGWDPERRR
jgi:1,2-phenylacetyl-CoA epoxidase catalytic subunit